MLFETELNDNTETRPPLNVKTVFPGMGILMLKTRRSRDRLIFNMVIPILVRRHFYIETTPRRLPTSRPLSNMHFRIVAETEYECCMIWSMSR